MTIECYFGQCQHHGTKYGEEGPFCFEEDCRMSELERRLMARGYDLEELDEDNPYTQGCTL